MPSNVAQSVQAQAIGQPTIFVAAARTSATDGSELEQIQFLLGHTSVQTTDAYLGCKQSLGSPVNDRFNLKVGVESHQMGSESAAMKGATPVERAKERHGKG